MACVPRMAWPQHVPAWESPAVIPTLRLGNPGGAAA